MRDFWHSALQSVYFPCIDAIEDTLGKLSTLGRVLFVFLAGVCVASSISLVYLLNDHFLVTTPSYGGSFSEGIIGSPRFINPVLAISEADRDLTALTYSGLLRATPEGGYINDLAQSYSAAEDGLTYTVELRPDATFSDGSPVTADDVLFTIQKTQDAALKSPLRANWSGVIAQKIDERTVRIELREPYAPFIKNLTLGILPKHLWEDVSNDEFSFSNLNVEPVGSGPFRVESIERGANGVPTSYTLIPFADYTLGAPYLSRLTLNFYQSESNLELALQRGDIEAASGLSPDILPTLTSSSVLHSPVNRVYAVFFNQNQSTILRDRTVRAALSSVVDRAGLVEEVLGGYGTPIDGPLPSDVASEQATSTLESAKQLLLNAGWKPGSDGILQKTTGSGKTASTVRLAFSLSTGDVPELRAAAQYLRTAWKELGVEVSLQIFTQGDLSQNVIRPRSYDALLFGEVVGRSPDLYAFWGSSERNDPGLNIALYANPAADKILTELRRTSDTSTQANLYSQLKDLLVKDIPALFLYTPDFVYSVPNDVQGVTLGVIETSSDRFLSVQQWHRQVDRVWPFFALKK